MNYFVRGACIAALIATTTACGMSQPGAKSMDKPPAYTAPTKTICAGRLLVDLPAKANAKLTARFRNVTVLQSQPTSDFALINERLKYQAQELDQIKIELAPWLMDNLKVSGLNPDKIYGKTRLLGFEINEAANQAIIGYHTSDHTSEFLVELHQVTGGWHYQFQSQSLHANRYPQVRDDLVAVASTFDQRRNNRIPDKPGFCIDGGFFAGQANYGAPNERFTLFVRLPRHPETTFKIMAFNVSSDESSERSLEERVEGSYARGKSLGFDIDRVASGKRRVAGQVGYQIITAFSFEDDGRKKHASKLRWESNGVYGDATRPKLFVTMNIDPQPEGQTSFENMEDIRALWNMMLESLHIRSATGQLR